MKKPVITSSIDINKITPFGNIGILVFTIIYRPGN